MNIFQNASFNTNKFYIGRAVVIVIFVTQIRPSLNQLQIKKYLKEKHKIVIFFIAQNGLYMQVM